MKYAIEFKPRAIKDLKVLAPRDRGRVLAKVEALQTGFVGDVKRVTNFTPEYRLRVGSYRVLFEIEESRLIIYRILPRGEAYR